MGNSEKTIERLGLLPWSRGGEGTLQFFAPEWLYDLCVWFFWLLNWLIAAAASRLPCDYAAPDWAFDPALAPDKLPPPTKPLPELAKIVRARDNTLLVDADVWSLFDSLPGPSTNDMLGTWRGKVVLSGSLLDLAERLLASPLRGFGLEWGKRYLTPFKGDPFLIFFGGKTVVPIPIWGNVSIPELSLRGKKGATMVYDHQPWKDHFRVLDDGKASGRRMMLGNWFSREKNGGWFTLEELPEMNAAASDLLVRSPY